MEKQKKIIFFSNEKEEKEKKEKRWMLEAIAHSCNPLLFPPKEAGEGKVRANTLEVDRRATASCCLASNQDGRASRCLIWSALYARCLFDCHSIVWSITYSLFFFSEHRYFFFLIGLSGQICKFRTEFAGRCFKTWRGGEKTAAQRSRWKKTKKPYHGGEIATVLPSDLFALPLPRTTFNKRIAFLSVRTHKG